MTLLERASSFQRSGFDRAPFVFSYDIHSEKVARAARRCLRRWRMDGQYSVHETVLTPSEAEALSVELIEIVDPETDSLIVFRLSRRGDGPIYSLSASATPRPFPVLPPPLPRHLHDGIYVVAYDVVDPRRLRRVQRVTSRQGLFLQRSVYLFSGEGVELARVLREAAALLEQGQDDLRVYALSGSDDLWFLCGATPPLAGLTSLQDRDLPLGSRDRTGGDSLGGDTRRVLHPGSDGAAWSGHRHFRSTVGGSDGQGNVDCRRDGFAAVPEAGRGGSGTSGGSAASDRTRGAKADPYQG